MKIFRLMGEEGLFPTYLRWLVETWKRLLYTSARDRLHYTLPEYAGLRQLDSARSWHHTFGSYLCTIFVKLNFFFFNFRFLMFGFKAPFYAIATAACAEK